MEKRQDLYRKLFIDIDRAIKLLEQIATDSRMLLLDEPEDLIFTEESDKKSNTKP